MRRGKKLISNLFLSGAVSVVMRYVGLRFNVFLTGCVGSFGMGIYTLIMSVGGFAITLALSGVGIGSTRLCSDAYAKKEFDKVRSSVRVCMLYALFFGLLSFVLLFSFAVPIANGILKNGDCALPLKMFAVSVPFMALSSALGGYFLSCQRIYKSLISGICQQFAAIGATVCFVKCCDFYSNPSFYIILGSVIGEIAGFVILLLFYVFEVKMHLCRKASHEKGLGKKLFGISLPIALSTYVRSILVSVEHILIPRGLARFSGNTEIALSSYGTLHAMAMPIILFPMVIISCLSGLLIPEMSTRNALCDYDGAKNISGKVFRLTLAYSIGCSGVMLLCSQCLGEVVYNNSQAGEYIRYVAPLIPIMYLDHVTDGMLKGLGEQLYCMKVNILDAAISVILVFFAVPYYGVIGYICIVYAMEIFNAFLSIKRLLERCNLHIDFTNWIFKPIVSIVGAGLLAKMLTGNIPCNTKLGLSITIVITAILYFGMLLLVRVAKIGEISIICQIFNKRKGRQRTQ